MQGSSRSPETEPNDRDFPFSIYHLSFVIDWPEDCCDENDKSQMENGGSKIWLRPYQFLSPPLPRLSLLPRIGYLL